MSVYKYLSQGTGLFLHQQPGLFRHPDKKSLRTPICTYIPSVLKHSLMSIVCSCMFGTHVHVHVLMSMSMLCTNGWEAPKLKGTFCL